MGGETCQSDGRNGRKHIRYHSGCNGMACVMKNSYKHERSLSSGPASPAAKDGYSGDKEVGDAHSSDDQCDNRTYWERRGITVSIVSEVRRTF